MKLSEAIYTGAAKRPQGYEAYVIVVGEQDTVYTCVLGAAYDGIDGDLTCSYTEINTALYQQFRLSLLCLATCPAAACTYPLVAPITNAVCLHLNDDHRWTREAIAAWLESEGL